MKGQFMFFVCMIMQLGIAQQYTAIDVLNGKANLGISAAQKTIKGEVIYTFKSLKDTQEFLIDAQKMDIVEVKLNDTKQIIEYDNKQLKITGSFKAGTTHKVKVTFVASPKKALYFVKDYQGDDQIWTQGQGKYTSNWLPSFDEMNQKVEFDLTIDYKKEYEVIANGKLSKKEMLNDSIQRWHYDMTHPMSSYLLALAIGKYEKKIETSTSGIPLEMYYYKKDESKFDSSYKHSKKMFDFLEEEIGFPYPWQNYKQIPVKDFLYAGMENTGTTIFSDVFMVDEIAYQDRNYINVNAHELAHQWFGDLVTAQHGTHHWLQEGFATYYALLVEKEIFGEDYFLYKLYESAEQLTELSKTDKATALLDPKASSLTFYQRGAWALYALRNVIGDTSFKITIHNYLNTYQFKNATTDNFIHIAEEVSGKDLSEYKKLWLEDTSFPSEQALALLTSSKFIKKYLTLAQERTQPLVGKWGALAKALDFPVNDYIGQEAVYQLQGDYSPEAIAIYDKAFETNNIFVRQAIANTMNKIPPGLKKQYESLLEDASYATLEPALYHLWANFSNDRAKYLDKTKDVIGFNDHNIRVLWLVLALSTRDYQTENHQKWFEELSGYTSVAHHFSTRQNAFQYLESMQAFSDPSLLSLVEGATHVNWRFRNSCRKILDKLLQNEKYKKKYVALRQNLPKHQKEFLDKKLTP